VSNQRTRPMRNLRLDGQ